MRTPQKGRVKELILSAILTLGIIWLLTLNWNIYQKEERARTALNETKSELASTAEHQAVLKQNIADLDTERGKEALVRQTLGVARPGEEAIIVVPDTNGAPQTAPLSWWQRVLRAVGL